MPFPRKLLTQDEELVLDLRPHWIALVGPVVVTILVIAAWIFLLSGHRLPGKPGSSTEKVFTWITLGVGLVILIAYSIRHLIRWLTSHFVVTNERVIHRSGWIAKNSMEVPLNRINDVRFHQNVFERMIGAGDLIIESAGTRGQEIFDDVRHPENLQKVIYERAEAYQGRMSAGGAVAQRSPSATEELQRLADLKDRGAITEEEFQAQKARLLGGG